jgi:hypothetical protein
MEVTLETLLKGKATRIKNNDFFPTEAYVQPFIDKMSKFTSDFRIQATLPDQITKTINDEINFDDITYNRVWVQAVLPDEYAFDNHDEVIGMVYGLDCRKPIVKIYRGGLNRACTNLCVFNPSFLHIQEIESEKPIDFRYINTIMEQTDDLKIWLDRLHNTEFDTSEMAVNESLGSWIRNGMACSYNNGFGKVKLGTTDIINAYKALFEQSNSPYFVGLDKPTDMFTVYNAFTQQITDDSRDIMNKVEKTLLVKDILGNV